MRPVQFIEKLYDAELALRSEITSSLSTPLAGLAALTAASGILMTKYRYGHDDGLLVALDYLFFWCSLAFALIVFLSAFGLFGVYMSQEYSYVRLAPDIEKIMDVSGEANLDEEGTDDDGNEAWALAEGDSAIRAVLERQEQKENEERGKKAAEDELSIILEEALVNKYIICIKSNRSLNSDRNNLRKHVAALVSIAALCFSVMLICFTISTSLEGRTSDRMDRPVATTMRL